MEITKAEDMKRDAYLHGMIYSKPGSGKTTTFKFLEGRTLVLDVDGSSQVLSGLPNIDIVKLDPSSPAQTMIEFYGYCKANQDKYESFVIDNLTHYQKLWLMEKGKSTKSGQPELQHYGIFDTHIIELISTFQAFKNKNIIWTAWETTRQIQTEGGQLYNQFLPDIRDKVVNHVMGIIPVVGRLLTNAETGVRGFVLRESNGTFAKNQLDNREHCLQDDLFKIGDVAID